MNFPAFILDSMENLPYGKLDGPARVLKLEKDTLLYDEGFSNKPAVIARKGETILIANRYNYGLVTYHNSCYRF